MQKPWNSRVSAREDSEQETLVECCCQYFRQAADAGIQQKRKQATVAFYSTRSCIEGEVQKIAKSDKVYYIHCDRTRSKNILELLSLPILRNDKRCRLIAGVIRDCLLI